MSGETDRRPLPARKVTWRTWAAAAAVLAAYLTVPAWLAPSDAAYTWIYRIGLTGVTFLPLAWLGVYTWTRARWWENDIGVSLAWIALALVPFGAPLAWAFWFNHGQLNASFIAWLGVAGPALSSLALLRACWVWARIHREGRNGGSGKDKP